MLGFNEIIQVILISILVYVVAIASRVLLAIKNQSNSTINSVDTKEELREECSEYKEAAKLLSQKVKELEKQLEETRKYDLRNLMFYCPRDKEYIEPIISNDGRLLCPKCNIELARIQGKKLEITVAGLKL